MIIKAIFLIMISGILFFATIVSIQPEGDDGDVAPTFVILEPVMETGFNQAQPNPSRGLYSQWKW